jgi:DNA-binding transcriptional regulator LsrR (DeoR family)
MNVLDDMSLVYRVAKYYYERNYTQNEISAMLSISRPQISRIIKYAKEIGMVKIKVLLSESLSNRQLSQELQAQYGFRDMIIAPSTVGSSTLCDVAAEYLDRELPKYGKIGIGWGQTIYGTSLLLRHHHGDFSGTFFPLAGNSGSNNPYLQTNSICDRFAEKFKGNAEFNNCPIVSLKDQLTELQIKRIEKLEQAWENLQVAVIGVGGKVRSDMLYIEELPEIEMLQQQIPNIIGDILGTMFLDNQAILKIPEEYQMSAISLEQFARIPTVICVAAGETKVDMLAFCLHKKMFDILITDEMTAKRIYELSYDK